MSFRESNTHFKILQDAEQGGYGVIAAIAYNIEQIIGLVQAAEEAKSPLILQFFPWALNFGNGLLLRTAREACSRATVPVSIHLDHCQTPELVKQAADMKVFDSIMIDMSHYEKEDNLRKTRALVQYCNDRHIVTEAEPGRIEGGEDGVVDTEALEGMMTTAEEIDDFVATGVDALAPAFGNMHGEYGPAGPTQLDFERLPQIRSQIAGRVRIALHGTNGFKPELMKKCIAAGTSKINVNRLVLDSYYEHLYAQAGKVPHTTLMEQGVKAVVELTKEWMVICGSAGRC